MNLEQIIRPFQSRDITPPRALPNGNRKDQSLLQVKFGNGGDKIFLYSTWTTPELSTNSDYTEIKRVTTNRTVKNKDDPSQSIDVKDTKELYLRGKADPSQRLTLYLKPDES